MPVSPHDTQDRIHRELLVAMFHAAVARALPSRVLPAHLPAPPKGRTVVIGAGKAAGAMAQTVESLWPREAPLSGVVVTRYGHTPPRAAHIPQRIRVMEAAHPVPDEATLRASRAMLEAVQGLSSDDLVLCLMSGGASSLLTLPGEGIDLALKQDINRLLLRSGAPIEAMNCVRKHLSRIKGGRLAAACGAARLLTLAISDVPGDDPAVIGSGPTVPDPTTSEDALAILDRYDIELPPRVRAALVAGALETPKPGDPVFERTQVKVVATPWDALCAAADVGRAAGFEVHLLGDAIEGESRDIGAMHAALARSCAQRGSPFRAPCILLSGGETTVTVRGAAHGRGGRAGEFCLGLARALGGVPGIWGLAADTDGIDGIEDNAGALVTPDTLARARHRGVSVDDHLDRHDAYSFFSTLGDLVSTGPTHTNVNDFRALLVA